MLSCRLAEYPSSQRSIYILDLEKKVEGDYEEAEGKSQFREEAVFTQT
jgi:hypothetical protein